MTYKSDTIGIKRTIDSKPGDITHLTGHLESDIHPYIIVHCNHSPTLREQEKFRDFVEELTILLNENFK